MIAIRNPLSERGDLVLAQLERAADRDREIVIRDPAFDGLIEWTCKHNPQFGFLIQRLDGVWTNTFFFPDDGECAPGSRQISTDGGYFFRMAAMGPVYAGGKLITSNWSNVVWVAVFP